MRVRNSSIAFPRLTAVVLLGLLPQISGAAPPGVRIQGTPIDSPPETNAPAAPVGTQTNGGYLVIGFDKLAGFTAGVVYEEGVTNGVKFPHAKEMTGQIPLGIKALDNQKVAVKGFMLPLKQADGLATDFILLRNRMLCCYGMMPNINEWIHVRMDGKGVRCIMDIPVTICGKLHVEEYRENRTMLGIYKLDGEKLEPPGDS